MDLKGGTAAMELFYLRLKSLGFNVLFCNETNKDSQPCMNPKASELIITGEWCRGVLEEYGFTEHRYSSDLITLI
jgi:hypothetical protein